MTNGLPPDNLPADLSIESLLGEGKRLRAWRGVYRGEPVAVKCYHPKFIDKYQRKYGVSIAQFEFDRNQAFHSVPELRAHTVRPVAVLRPREGYPETFIQALAPGRRLLDVVNELGYLPEESGRAGLQMVQRARQAGIHDLDINDANVNLHLTQQGWMPVVYDFNMMPQHLHPTNPIMFLGFLLRIRDRSYRDFRSVRGWHMRGEQARARVAAGHGSG